MESSRKDFKVKSGSGPRHLIFSKNGGYLYLVNELSGTAIAYKYNNGDIEQLQELCIGMERQEGGGGMALSADEKYLYVSMREGNDGISTFKIQNDGTLSHFAYNNVSEHPRDITLSSDGRYLLAAAMKENKIDIMKILDDGKLANTEIYIHLDKPAYVGFI